MSPLCQRIILHVFLRKVCSTSPTSVFQNLSELVQFQNASFWFPKIGHGFGVYKMFRSCVNANVNVRHVSVTYTAFTLHVLHRSSSAKVYMAFYQKQKSLDAFGLFTTVQAIILQFLTAGSNYTTAITFIKCLFQSHLHPTH